MCFAFPKLEKNKKFLFETLKKMPAFRSRVRPSPLPRLELEGTPDMFESNTRLVHHVQQAYSAVHVVMVGSGWVVPWALARLTNSILFVDDKIDLSVAYEMLVRNENLHIYAYLLTIYNDDKELELPLDWGRIHAAHIIIGGYPSREGNYKHRYDQFKKAAPQVYQALDPMLQLGWHTTGIHQFVILRPEFNLRQELQPLPAGLVVFHASSLEDQRDPWTAQALRELEKGGYNLKRPRPEFEETKIELDELGQMRKKLEDALASPVQNPAHVLQPYHKVVSDKHFADAWMSFLGGEHPDFCYFKGDMFVYQTTEKTLTVAGDLLQALAACDLKHRFFIGTMFLHNTSMDVRHTNAIIIDTHHSTLARFEPNGGSDIDFYDADDLDAQLQAFVDQTRGYGFSQYRPPSRFCAMAGPQTKSDWDIYFDFDEPRADQKDRGWCRLFSLMFIHYRLAFPEKSDSDVEKMLSSRSGGQLALEIRSYSNAVALNVLSHKRTIVHGKYLDIIMDSTHLPNERRLTMTFVNMNDQYPTTRFRCSSSLDRAPEILIEMGGRVDGNSLLVKYFPTKMWEVVPRSLIGHEDTPIIKHAELLMFYHILQNVVEVDNIQIWIEKGFEWYIAELGTRAAPLPLQMWSEMKQTVPDAKLQLFMVQQLKAQVEPEPIDSMEPQEIESAFVWLVEHGEIDLRGTWTDMKSVRQRADYYVKTLGFEIEEPTDVTCVMIVTTRRNIYTRFRQVERDSPNLF
jgi:hypothetical protein